ncbi:hypothetical protein F0562_016814 [Nyssa sinensis]|uniref:Uncharacterized protein n=1 Tax=Nyssa sinensis TaxID=561372 RepID=A0A5J4ZDV9_9ASTE|nr:hypothetical protein F0562_016814 [Nyssa sinensis]
MRSNPAGEEAHLVINIGEVNKDRIQSMQQKISDAPRLLSKSAGRSSCCIFRVPQSLVDINGQSYQPQIVSIGPFHHGKPHLQMIEEHKWRFLGALLNRTQKKGLRLEDLWNGIQPLEIQVRECYSQTIHFDSHEFVEMLVLDGCFLIELFRIVGGLVQSQLDDPLFSVSWVYPILLRDLIRLENQIPFLILQSLFDITQMADEEHGPSLATLALEFFNGALQRPYEVLAKYSELQGKHLLDFIRSSFIPMDQEERSHRTNSQASVIPCISKLRRAGIKFLRGKEDSFLQVKFRHGVIEMPTILIDDFTSCFLLNCVAYEQCHRSCSKHVTVYATLLDFLVNTVRDVEYLSDGNIIENYIGGDAAVAKLIKNMGKELTASISSTNQTSRHAALISIQSQDCLNIDFHKNFTIPRQWCNFHNPPDPFKTSISMHQNSNFRPQFPGHDYSSSSESTSFESNASEDNLLRYPPPSSERCTTSETTFPPPPEPTPKAEVEAVDELLQILVECLDELHTKSRELLLRKFFSEIEKEASVGKIHYRKIKTF